MHKILHLIAKISLDEKKAPEWVVLFRAGLNRLVDGLEFIVDKSAYEMVRQYVAAIGNEIHWDYEHASLQAKEAAPASGWIKELVWDDAVGIKARVEWTEKAAAHIVAKEYRYFSPVFFVRKQDKRVCGLDSVGLTNRPRTTNLIPILAKLGADLESQEKIMDRIQLIASLKLPPDVTDEQIWEALGKIGIAAKASAPGAVPELPVEVITALDLKAGEGVSAAVASINVLKQYQQGGALGVVSRAEFDALQKQIRERDAADAVVAAMGAGKIAPAQKEWAMAYATSDLTGFNMFVAKAPVVVPVNSLPGKTEQPAAAGEVTEELKVVAGQMGISLEDVKKYGMAEVING